MNQMELSDVQAQMAEKNAKKDADEAATLTFEQAMERLETIAQAIERGDGTLDQAMALYEEGVKLASFCEQKLGDLSERLAVLRIAPDGSETEAPILDR